MEEQNKRCSVICKPTGENKNIYKHLVVAIPGKFRFFSKSRSPVISSIQPSHPPLLADRTKIAMPVLHSVVPHSSVVRNPMNTKGARKRSTLFLSAPGTLPGQEAGAAHGSPVSSGQRGWLGVELRR